MSTRRDTDPLDILDELVRIPSHEDDTKAAHRLAERLERLRPHGVRVSLHEVREQEGSPVQVNVRAEWGEGGRSLLLNSHLDTVPPGPGWPTDPFTPTRQGEWIQGLGTADAKGCLAAMVSAFERLTRTLPRSRGRLVLTAVALEESAGRGTRAEVEAGVRADAAIVGEPTELELCVAHKGVLRMEVATNGTAAHASEPWAGASAISAMHPVLASLDRLAEAVASRREEPVGRSSLAVTTIAGGTARNVIPARCVISLDRRLLPREDASAARAEIEEAVRSASRTAEISPILLAEAASTPADAELVRAALAELSSLRGVRAAPTGFGACCDMHLIRNEGGMPCVILGPGSLSQAHHAGERVRAEEVRLAADLYERIAARWLSGTLG